jgi:hypothetical protein
MTSESICSLRRAMYAQLRVPKGGSLEIGGVYEVKKEDVHERYGNQEQ